MAAWGDPQRQETTIKRWQDPAQWHTLVDVLRSHHCRWGENWWDVFILPQDVKSFCLLLFLFTLFSIVCLFCWGCVVSEKRIMFVSLFFLLLLKTVNCFQPLVSEVAGDSQSSWQFCKGFCNGQCCQASPGNNEKSLRALFNSKSSFPLFINLKKLVRCKHFKNLFYYFFFYTLSCAWYYACLQC